MQVYGDPAEGANCHEVEVTAIDEHTGSITVHRPHWEDENTPDESGRPTSYADVTISGLRQDEFVRCPELRGEGDESATVLEYDPEFAKDVKSTDCAGYHRFRNVSCVCVFACIITSR